VDVLGKCPSAEWPENQADCPRHPKEASKASIFRWSGEEENINGSAGARSVNTACSITIDDVHTHSVIAPPDATPVIARPMITAFMFGAAPATMAPRIVNDCAMRKAGLRGKNVASFLHNGEPAAHKAV
jgi:hypothetical protein